jgi:hypothetical protein
MVFYVTPLRQGRFPEIATAANGAITVLFSTIELIFDGNNELLTKLKEETKHADPLIGKVFEEMTDQLCQYYGVFCNHQKDAMDSIAQIIQTSAPFKSFLESCKSKTETNGLGLLDFLVKPFQRLLKYPLLLRELNKNTAKSHPDKQHINRALAKLNEEVELINKHKFKNDNLKKMLEINQAVDSLPKHFKFMVPSRVYVYEGTLGMISGKHDQERHFFLFNDCLIYCKKRGQGKYQCKGVIFLNKLTIEDLDAYTFKIHRADKDLTYTLYGKTQQEKEQWVHEINTTQQKLNPSSRTNLKSLRQGESKEIIRVYINKESFKTLAVTAQTSTAELSDMCSKKLAKVVGSSSKFRIALVVNGKGNNCTRLF